MSMSFFAQVYLIVRQIPRGKVAAYGQIAGMLGHPRAGRTVGWALSSLSAEQAAQVPWQRVINHAGRISLSRADVPASLQRHLLEEEGIAFDADDRIDLIRFGWHGLPWEEIQALLGPEGA
jgi:methylated-DNA-protein-cysteine methyltransferase related protein